MNKEYLNKLEELDYAVLDEDQREKLRGMEHEFNNEYATDYYFMVMRKE